MGTRWMAAVAAGVAAAAAVTAMVLSPAEPAAGGSWQARAVLRDAGGVRIGTVKFDGDPRSTTVKVTVDGYTAGAGTFHGLHIHANPTGGPCDPATAFANVQGHWSPSGMPHGFHEGDLPSLLVQADGSGTGQSVTDRIDPGALVGRAVVLHIGPDNLANIPPRYTAGGVAGPDSTTLATGDSGGRAACGVITGE
ncbi:MAG: superoxide dismutase family protein [Ilumatobacteraceae bacterium]